MPYNSDGSHKESNRVGLGGLWQQTDKNGNKYLSGSLGFAKLLIFPNRNKTHDNQPDYNMVLVEKPRDGDKPETKPAPPRDERQPWQSKTASLSTPQPPADDDVPFYGAEGGGTGTDSKRHAAPLAAGREDVLHGMKTRVIEDDVEVHSVSAGLDYPGVGPEHAMFRDIGRCEYVGVTDDEALKAFRTLSETEGIIPALESSHALALAEDIADDLPRDGTIIVNLSGRGDKDMETAAELFDLA